MSLNDIEIGDLNEPAQILARNAQALDAGGQSAPDIPNAGQSTALVGDAIAALAQAMSDLVVSSARAADAIESCDDGYSATEDTNTADLSGGSR